MKVLIYPKDHYPPHFHVTSVQRNIDAQFSLDSLELIKDQRDNIKADDVKKIQSFFNLFKNQKEYLLKEYNRLNQ